MPCTPDAMASSMDDAIEWTMDDTMDHAMDDDSSMDCTMAPSMDPW